MRTLVMTGTALVAVLAIGAVCVLQVRRAASPADPSAATDATGPEQKMSLGERTYHRCIGCHRPDGRGVPGVVPSLARVSSAPPLRAVRVVLAGLVAEGGKPSAMPGFAAQLSDDEIAAVIDHMRVTWGPGATPPIDPAMVARERAARTSPWTRAELAALEPAQPASSELPAEAPAPSAPAPSTPAEAR